MAKTLKSRKIRRTRKMRGRKHRKHATKRRIRKGGSYDNINVTSLLFDNNNNTCNVKLQNIANKKIYNGTIDIDSNYCSDKNFPSLPQSSRNEKIKKAFKEKTVIDIEKLNQHLEETNPEEESTPPLD